MTVLPDRLVSMHSTSEEVRVERSTRPLKLGDYIGQNEAREQVGLFIEAAKQKQEPLDHVLIAGPPGLGKTTLANIIAREMEVQIKATSGPALEKAGDLAALLTHLTPKDVLFIDEIHRLSPAIEEILYPALEDYQLDIVIGEGPNARSIKLDLPPFTLIGATTRTGRITSPLRDRFGIIQRLVFYAVDDLAHIVTRAAKLLQIPIDEAGALAIAQCARGTPRIANRLLRRVYDFSLIKGEGTIDQKMAIKALNFLAVDQRGFDQQDRAFLLTILEQFGGGPAGLESLAAAMGESSETVEEVIEPFLIQQGFIIRTRRGRIAAAKSYQHFGLDFPHSLQPSKQLTLDEAHKSESN